MRRAVEIDRWDHTAQLLCAIINQNRRSSEAISFERCHPYRDRVEHDITVLKKLLGTDE